ncbi:alpha/beta fold hydrolase [soil metagenome]
MKIQQKLAIGFIRTKINIIRIVSTRKAAEETFRLFCTPMMRSAIREKEVFLSGESLQFTLNNTLIKGFRCNHPQQKKILLLHGFSSSSHNFYQYVQPLVEKGYEVLAFDAPAHGASGGKMVNAIDYSEMIKKIMERYGPIHGFISHSFGGIALSLAMEAIPHDASSKIVFIAPATETSTAVDGAFQMLGLKSDKVRKEFDHIVFEKSGQDTTWFSVRRAMHNIKAAVLWIHDEDDDITPLSDALRVKEDGHPNVRFIITQGLGHRKIYRNQPVIDAVMKFF